MTLTKTVFFFRTMSLFMSAGIEKRKNVNIASHLEVSELFPSRLLRAARTFRLEPQTGVIWDHFQSGLCHFKMVPIEVELGRNAG